MTIRVLLADDHAMMRDGLTSLLSASPGIEVVGAVSNGREAVHCAAELEPDIVIMDISMPELNGIEAAQLIRARSPGVRIVMLSMHSSSEHLYRALAAGAAGYLLKESAGTEAVAAVHAVHAGRRYMSQALRPLALEQPVRDAGPIERLSSRERQVLQLVVEGHSSVEIAGIVHLSPKSVETYRSRLMTKIGISDVPGLVKFALQHGITSLD
jgi:DNA-binding NarL/FixJ family response regulator